MEVLTRYDPFTYINVIKDPDEFFGRKEEIRTVFTRLSNLQSTSIYGERKIGKSSLLYHIFQNILEEDKYKSAYIDLRDSKYHTSCDFLKSVLLELECDPSVILEKNTYHRNLVGFSESIKDLRKKCKPVLLIDEFDHIIKKPEEFNKDFLETLRTLGYHGHIAYVTASLRSLKELCIESKLNSTLYLIFSDIQLGELTSDETTDFLSAERKGVNFNAEEIKLIKEIAGNKPLHLRIACAHIFENKRKKWNRNKLKGEIETQIRFYDDKTARRDRNLREFGKEAAKHTSKIIEKLTGLIKIFLS